MNNYWTESRTKNTCSLYWIYRIISELDTWTKSGHVWKQSFKTMRSAQKKKQNFHQLLQQPHPSICLANAWASARLSCPYFLKDQSDFLSTFSTSTCLGFLELHPLDYVLNSYRRGLIRSLCKYIYIYNIDIYIKNKNAYIQIACRLLVWANKESNQYNIGQLYHLEIGFVLWAIFGLIRNFTRRDWR